VRTLPSSAASGKGFQTAQQRKNRSGLGFSNAARPLLFYSSSATCVDGSRGDAESTGPGTLFIRSATMHRYQAFLVRSTRRCVPRPPSHRSEQVIPANLPITLDGDSLGADWQAFVLHARTLHLFLPDVDPLGLGDATRKEVRSQPHNPNELGGLQTDRPAVFSLACRPAKFSRRRC
jgi:hypothetical protein